MFKLFHVRTHSAQSQVSLASLEEWIDLSEVERIQFPGCEYAMVKDGKVFIDTNTVNLLGAEAKHLRSQIKFGKRNFFDIESKELAEEVVQQNNFPARSKIEKAVRSRNLKLWGQLHFLAEDEAEEDIPECFGTHQVVDIG